MSQPFALPAPSCSEEPALCERTVMKSFRYLIDVFQDSTMWGYHYFEKYVNGISSFESLEDFLSLVCGYSHIDRDAGVDGQTKMNKAQQLGIPEKRQKFYKTFTIPKKSSGVRTITAPTGYLKEVQKRISIILTNFYTAPSSANGFIKKRNVLTNAAPHLERNYVFNTDIEDFFPSISRKMVVSALRKFSISDDIAEYIATVCTVTINGEDGPANVLPQGSPASPVISNMVCYHLDIHMEWLARKFGLSYSRYADDMTFSSMYNAFSPNGEFMRLFKTAISNSGFRLNGAKTRLQKRGSRQEVTGIIVCNKLNLSRRYLKALRAEIFQMETETDNWTAKKLRSILGKLEYVKMVRGKEDPLYQKLNSRMNAIYRNVAVFFI